MGTGRDMLQRIANDNACVRSICAQHMVRKRRVAVRPRRQDFGRPEVGDGARATEQIRTAGVLCSGTVGGL